MKHTINCITYLTIALLFGVLSVRAFFIHEFIMGTVFLLFCFVLTICAARA